MSHLHGQVVNVVMLIKSAVLLTMLSGVQCCGTEPSRPRSFEDDRSNTAWRFARCRRFMIDDPLAKKSFGERAEEWLKSPEASARAERVLARAKLHVDPADVVAEVQYGVWKVLAGNPDGLAGANEAAYCTTAINNAVNDVLRGFKGDRARLNRLKPLAVDKDQAATSPPELGGEFSDELRSAVEIAGHPDWVTAAALTFVTLTSYPESDISGAPEPNAGARPDQARMWPSLWFAGRRHGLFPQSGVSDATHRKRLERAGASVRDLIDHAAKMTTTGSAL